MVSNEENELLPTMTIMGWRICMDYQKLDKVMKNDCFPPLIDQILDRLADIVEDFLEIFMDDFFVLGDDFDKCLGNLAKERLVIAPIVVPPNLKGPFELMCNESDYIVGAVLGQRREVEDRKGSEIHVDDHLYMLDNIIDCHDKDEEILSPGQQNPTHTDDPEKIDEEFVFDSAADTEEILLSPI
ncbi:uncharacterized protein LOC120147849 [Hibiscus syriacus]|uniref:uncharacterized protein LOC120147849 n=1 Tax=Hibiscus syriacus TaxID=106335 RepID=UPI00192044C1|nr:uncharacterized protein LOC120147849 [Hibiscus syriacus]